MVQRYATFAPNGDIDEIFNSEREAMEYLDALKESDPETFGDYHIADGPFWDWEVIERRFFVITDDKGVEFRTSYTPGMTVWEHVEKIDRENGTHLINDIDRRKFIPREA